MPMSSVDQKRTMPRRSDCCHSYQTSENYKQAIVAIEAFWFRTLQFLPGNP